MEEISMNSLMLLAKNGWSLGSGLLLLLLALLLMHNLVWRLFRDPALPPCRAGWIPFVGCAIQFGQAPLTYIEKCRLELGPVFTLYIAGRRLTYLTEEEDYERFFLQSEHVDFQKAVELFVQNAGSISTESFSRYHTGIHDMMKGKLASGKLPQYKGHLEAQFSHRMDEMRLDGTYELNELTRLIMYPSVIRNLFGDSILPMDSEEKVRELMDKFVLFDDQFEYGTQIPQIFLRRWALSKSWLLGMFKQGISKIQATDQTLLKELYDSVDKPHAANYSLLMLWASLANAIPITFWTISYIINNERVHAKVKATVKSVHGETSPDYQSSDLNYIKCCILEAIRIRSPGIITRMVVKPFEVQGFTVPAGDLVMLSPHWVHRNVDNFPEPEQYQPERWAQCDFSKNELLKGFVAFGGGRYMCPGRWYALMELQMIITLMFDRYDITSDSLLPDPDVMHLVGVQQPSEKYHVKIHPRKD